MPKLTRYFLGVLLIILSLVSCGTRSSERGDADTQKDTIYPLGFLTDTLRLRSLRIKSGENFALLMRRAGLASDSIYPLTIASDSVFDVSRIIAGHTADAYYSGDTLAPVLEYMVYHNDRVNSTVFKCKDSMAVWAVSKQVDTLRKYIDVTINASLWQDLADKGESPILISAFESVYEWTVNFFGLHKGDRFQAICRERVCDNEVVDVLGFDFSVYSRGSDSLYAIRFDQGDNGNKYWNQKGESMRKAFLKAPLQFSRISSRFTYHRKHPIYGVVRPHTGIDYAAPSGTPVRALGDGVITRASWDSKGGGNYVRIRHNNAYETGYMHLRGYGKGIKAGVRVVQGQIIGYVGSTGASTGPHLDFRIWKNGRPIDPLKLESPPTTPLKSENMPALDSLFRMYKKELATLEKAAN